MKHFDIKKLLITVIVLLCSVSANAHDFEVDGIYYKILSASDLTAQVTYKGNSYDEFTDEYSGEVIIPSTVSYKSKTLTVASIGKSTFQKCSGLTSITIPNSVTSIENNAFYYCKGLTSITIPNSVTSIGNEAFSNCDGLTSVTIGNSVTSIKNGAFYNCDGLTSITIPNSVTSIGNEAFYHCDGLTSITIPNSVTSIGISVFSGLESIVVDAGNTKYDSRENCNAIIETSSNTLLTGCKNTVIPNSVTSIGGRAFRGCSGLTSVEIPNSVTSIGYYAFYGCSGLTSIIVKEGNTVYDSRNNCNAIIETSSNTLLTGCKNTVIPNSVTSIGDWAFSGCSGLTSITIPNSVTSIGWSAFYNCSGLTSIVIPNGVTSIGASAFNGCYGITSITMMVAEAFM